MRRDDDELSIFRVGTRSDADHSSVAIEALIAAMRSDSDKEVRETAVWALGNIGDRSSADALASALSDPDPEIHGRYSRATYPAWFVDPELAAYFAPPVATSATGAAVAAQLRKSGFARHGPGSELSNAAICLCPLLL